MILLTGAGGFIGGVLERRLGGEHAVISLSRRPRTPQPGAAPLIADLCSLAPDDARLPDHLELVVHCAGVTHAPSKQQYWRDNVEATRAVIAICRARSAGRLVLISTAAVTSTVQGPYSRSKQAAEQLVIESGLPYVILRPALVYGRGDRRNLGQVAELVRRSPVVPIAGSGRGKLQPVWVEDVAAAAAAAASGAAALQHTFFLAGLQAVTMRELITMLAGVLRRRPRVLPLPPLLLAACARAGLAPGISVEQILRADEDKLYDIEPARARLGFVPCPLSEGLARTFGVPG